MSSLRALPLQPLVGQLCLWSTVAGGLLLAGCNAEMTSNHATLAAAQETIAKGWIPAVLPPSTTHIQETHNLDLNTGHGTFAFATSDAATFRSRLIPLTPDELPRQTNIPSAQLQRDGYTSYRFEEFYLAVDWPHQRGEFWLIYSH